MTLSGTYLQVLGIRGPLSVVYNDPMISVGEQLGLAPGQVAVVVSRMLEDGTALETRVIMTTDEEDDLKAMAAAVTEVADDLRSNPEVVDLAQQAMGKDDSVVERFV